MGTYTNTLKLYKPVDVEVVDVEQHLNYNWDICDKQFKRLLEYEYVNAPNPDVTEALNASRYYKPYSNSLIAWLPSAGGFWQDPMTFVSDWVDARFLLTEDWNSFPDFRICYRVITKVGGTTSTVEWAGAFQSVTQGPMGFGASQTVIPPDQIPVGVRPNAAHYFTANAGNTAANYAFARLQFNTNGELLFYGYGNTPSAGASIENRVELTDVSYCVEVTGT